MRFFRIEHLPFPELQLGLEVAVANRRLVPGPHGFHRAAQFFFALFVIPRVIKLLRLNYPEAVINDATEHGDKLIAIVLRP
jgi:hypothetical protein